MPVITYVMDGPCFAGENAERDAAKYDFYLAARRIYAAYDNNEARFAGSELRQVANAVLVESHPELKF